MPFSQQYLDRKVDNRIRAVNMGNEMSLVLPHLYLGSLKDRTNTELMLKNKVKRVLCIIDVPEIIVDKGDYKPTHLLNIQAADVQEQNLAQHFEKCIDFIHQARIEHENILVHCQAGVSRSATVVVAYVMTVGDYDVEKALQIVKGARGFIHPNPGFLLQLKKYYMNDVKKNWYRLTRRYHTYTFGDVDERFIQISLDVYWQQFEPAFVAEPAQRRLEKKFGDPLRTESDLLMCEENERSYRRMIPDDLTSRQLLNNDSKTYVIEQNTPSIVEQLIDNDREQQFKRIVNSNMRQATSIINSQQCPSIDNEKEKQKTSSSFPLKIQHQQNSKRKLHSSKTNHHSRPDSSEYK